MAIKEISTTVVPHPEFNGRLYDLLFQFFQINSTPSDEQVHYLAKSLGQSYEALEETIYAMLAEILESVDSEEEDGEFADFDEEEALEPEEAIFPDNVGAQDDEDSAAWADHYSTNDLDLEETDPQILMTSTDRLGSVEDGLEAADEETDSEDDELVEALANDEVKTDLEKRGLANDGEPDTRQDLYNDLLKDDGYVEDDQMSLPFAADDGLPV